MKKKIFCGHWFYIVGGIILSLLSLSLVLFEIAQVITVSKEVNPTIIISYWILPLLILMAVYMCWAMGYWMIQFTMLTEEGIKVRCLWCTIRKLKWEEVKEVRFEKFYVSMQGFFSSGWYVFDDGIERKMRNGIVRRNSHITLTASKRAKKAIEEFWKGDIKEKTIT